MVANGHDGQSSAALIPPDDPEAETGAAGVDTAPMTTLLSATVPSAVTTKFLFLTRMAIYT